MASVKLRNLWSPRYIRRALNPAKQHALYSSITSPPISPSNAVPPISWRSDPQEIRSDTKNITMQIAKNDLKPKIQKKAQNIAQSDTSLNQVCKVVPRHHRYMPSESSGGIPSVTEEYLIASRSAPEGLLTPQHLLVVLDLNGTLIHRRSKRHPKRYTIRPHTQEFLEHCLNTFTVVIWSSARPETVDSVVKSILPPPLRKKLVAIWARDTFCLSKADYNNRVLCYKRLTALWMDPKISKSHPMYNQGARWNHTNTVLIDDSAEKSRSEPHNLIEIPTFSGEHQESVDVLTKVTDYLKELSLYSSVCSYIHAHPFSVEHAKASTEENVPIE
ncbi:hypothetical protein K3495_g2918 [Podosphaera aphanis]|nr:hypothetical protein K3495_g2918 [Podosphaera aphanis]